MFVKFGNDLMQSDAILYSLCSKLWGEHNFFQIRSLDIMSYAFGQHVVKVHCAAAVLLLLEEEFSLVRVVFYSARVH